MYKITLCVGFDYHDDLIRVCIMDEDGNVLLNRAAPNDVGYVIDLVSQYGSFAVCAVEACCGAADFAHRLRTSTGWDVRLAHPGYARRLKQSPDKSDHDDAELLADLVRVRYLPEVWLAPTETRELRRLKNRIEGLVYSNEKVFAQFRDVLPEKERRKLSETLLRSRMSLSSDSRADLETALFDLNSISRMLSEMMLSQVGEKGAAPKEETESAS